MDWYGLPMPRWRKINKMIELEDSSFCDKTEQLLYHVTKLCLHKLCQDKNDILFLVPPFIKNLLNTTSSYIHDDDNRISIIAYVHDSVVKGSLRLLRYKAYLEKYIDYYNNLTPSNKEISLDFIKSLTVMAKDDGYATRFQVHTDKMCAYGPFIYKILSLTKTYKLDVCKCCALLFNTIVSETPDHF
eukprot:4409271-Ditylum_brightwellii.AAC.1